MKPEDRQRFPATSAKLKDGRAVTLRPLVKDDAEALADFYETVPPEDFRFYCPRILNRENAHAVAARADSPYEVCVVLATPDRGVGGYAWCQWKDDAAECSVFGVCVRRDYQGAGAGRALMTRINAIAAEIGPPVMTLTAQLANPSAVALYQSMGFRIVRRQTRKADHKPGMAAEPEYFMERRTR